MRFRKLASWLEWQSGLHPSAIDLGLERSAAVAKRLALDSLDAKVVSVAGTNGKGSCVATMDAILRCAGYSVGAYLSPHLLRYNERIRINGEDVSDEALVAAFALVDEARGDTSLTFFEFGTLAAVVLFAQAGVEIILLEVGLGGRLDAVNVFDADVSVLSAIDIDHVEWLGHDREQIGREKAGIQRMGKPCVIGERTPPASVINHGASLGAPICLLGEDFHVRADETCWHWSSDRAVLDNLPLPALAGLHQLDNAATAMMAAYCLTGMLTHADACTGLRDTRLAGRFQVLRKNPDVIVDVAHNPHAARVLASTLSVRPCRGRTLALVAMFKDKDISDSVRALVDHVDEWYVTALDSPRGSTPTEALSRLIDMPNEVVLHTSESVREGYFRALQQLRPDDRLIVFGSHQTVAEVLQLAC